MNHDKLEIQVLGGLELRYKDAVIGVNMTRGKSKKMWTLFEYVLLNRTRKVSQEELIEMLWPAMDVADPANSLKALVFKLRKEIDSLGFIPGKEVFLCTNSSFSINPDIEYTLDLWEFEDYKKLAEQPDLSEDEVLDYLLKALDAYKGNVLYNVGKEPWTATIQIHYYELYRNVVNRAHRILEKRNDFERIIEICKGALLIGAYTEEYYFYLIKAYAALENYDAAAKMYQRVKEIMQKEYGTSPDNKLEGAYKELMKVRPKKNLSVERLTNDFIEPSGFMAAFNVEYGEFRQIYRLYARRLERFIAGAFLSLYTLGAQKGVEVSEEEKRNHLNILGEALAFALRQGDVMTRATPNQFAVIFEDIAVENIQSIAERVKRYFDHYKKSKCFGIIHSYAPIEPSSFEKRADRDVLEMR
ncbi:DNA-binding SARP family transcriptional activator [Clostridiales Family XIII bacterium PM5-7]